MTEGSRRGLSWSHQSTERTVRVKQQSENQEPRGKKKKRVSGSKQERKEA